LEYCKNEHRGLGNLMLNFEKLILHNFGSYGHAELDLKNKGFCLVVGKNEYAKDNALSNGSGKSFLWNAICYAFTGETISGLHSNLKNINISEDTSCYVEVFFRESSNAYHIVRSISPKSDLKIIKNDVDVSGKGIRESEKKLAELLPDLTKNLITSTIIIGQGMPNKFSSFSPSGRKELLERLTRADFMIEDIKQRVTGRQGELATEIRRCEDSILTHTAQASILQAEFNQKHKALLAAPQSKPDFAAQILQLEQEVVDAQKSLSIKDFELKDLEGARAQATSKLLVITNEKAATLSGEQEAYTAAILVTQQQQLGLKSTIESLTREISRLKQIKDTCPTCGQKLPGQQKPDTSNLEQELLQVKSQLDLLDNKLTQQENRHKQYQQEIEEQFKSELSTIQAENVSLDSKLVTLKAEIAQVNATYTKATAELEKLRYACENWEKNYQILQARVTELETELQKHASLVTILEQDKNVLDEHLKMVKKMDTLIKRDFRGYLLANIITYINLKAKDYCSIVFGTRDLEVYLEGNDLNISYCGKMFDNLSGGEKQRVDLILQFAIRNMLTAYLNFNSNILVLDEITDFLDKKSCSAILELITKELNTIESVFIVSHHASELDLPIDSEVVIRKNEAGISEILTGAC
jgi:DNA repair exonuclease SbcCD ATPase subunit